MPAAACLQLAQLTLGISRALQRPKGLMQCTHCVCFLTSFFWDKKKKSTVLEYNSTVFGIVTELCNCHHNLLLEHFHHPPKTVFCH